MRMQVNVQTRLALIEDWRWEMIHGEDASPLNILLYLLVKQNDVIVNGFDHRDTSSLEQFIAEKVKCFYAHRPMIIPLNVLEVSNARIRFQQLRFDVVEFSDLGPLQRTYSSGFIEELERQQHAEHRPRILRRSDSVCRSFL